MTSTRTRALRRLLTIVVSAAALGAIASVGPADALPQEGFTLPGGETVERSYPPIPSNDPATVTVDHTVMDPETCAQFASCAVVPIDIELPDLEPGDDFYVRLTISWEVTDISDNNVQPLKSNDLDVFLYDDGQKAEEEGSSGYTEIGSSATGDMPEMISAFEPTLGTYNLVVINFLGGNTGWTLKAESLVGEFEKPYEVLAPGPTTTTTRPPTTTTTRPSAAVAPTTTITIPTAEIIPDDDFEGGAFAPTNDFTNQLVAQTDELAAVRETLAASRGTGDSPSATSVVLWMLVMPAVVIGAAIVAARVLKQRRRAAARAAASPA
jgi:hypothetical protein